MTLRCMTALLALTGSLLLARPLAGQEAPGTAEPPFNAYERRKNGPPLTNVFHKAHPDWIREKLLQPRHHPAARMPDLRLTEEEVVRIMAYLRSVADPDLPAVAWPEWVVHGEEELERDEGALDELCGLLEEGQAVWGRSRCSICHVVNSPVANDARGQFIGGFVDLRVGGMDLSFGAHKLERDWLYRWLHDPKTYFPHTLMPRFRFSDREIRALVEYLLRDAQFGTFRARGAGTDGSADLRADHALAADGKRLIELSRCVACHDIRGIPEVLPPSRETPTPPEGSFAALVYDLRCLTCHRVAGRGGAYAPDLTAEGGRLKPEWIRAFVHRPDTIRPLSEQMPLFNLTEKEAATLAEAIGAGFVDPGIPADVPGGPAKPGEVDRGRDLFRVRGCVACHTTGEGPGGAVGPSLDRVADRVRPGNLYAHLRDPRRVNPLTVEPDHGLSEEDARSLALYLSTRTEKPTAGEEMKPAPPLPRPLAMLPGLDLIDRRNEARAAFQDSPQAVYGRTCAHCHGDRGKGDGRLWSADLGVKPADLTALTADEGRIAQILRAGTAAAGKSALCGPWGRTVGEERIPALAAYVRNLAHPEPAANPTRGAPGVKEEFGEPVPWDLLVIIGIELYLLLRLARRPGAKASQPSAG